MVILGRATPFCVLCPPSTTRSVDFQADDKNSLSPNFDGEVPNGPTRFQPISSLTTEAELSAATEATLLLSTNFPVSSAQSEDLFLYLGKPNGGMLSASSPLQ